MSSNYTPTIGLEIHAELQTASKMFCSCKNDPFEDTPNLHVCPVCMGHPGTLPVLNKEAIRFVLKMGIAINGTRADFTEWDRKNYFYPDIPKGYQISQYKYPLISGGELSGVALERIHLEEDTAQSTHDAHEKSLVNFNRAGVPLMELVTKPVIHDAATSVRFAKELQLLLRYIGAGAANMEKGEMRVEANISVATPENTAAGKFGTKTEVKNLNSFRAVEKAIDFEIARQSALLDEGGTVVQETRGWDDTKQETYSQRTKESSHDYRYFPDPDLPKLKLSQISEFAIETLKKELPELPWVKRDRFKTAYAMTDKEVAVFIDSTPLSSYYESIVSTCSGDAKRIKLTTNYLLTDYLKLVKDVAVEGTNYDYSASIPSATFADLITMVAAGDINSRAAKDILGLLFTDTSASPKALAEKHGLIQKSDASELIPAIEKVISDNAAVVAEYKGGKVTSLQFLIGQAMKATKGSGNPEVVKKLLIEKLG
ncbi:MAG: Asp-tRNA(Asn)/Glu-tRNA(Gln) amidotransferase subunit GatB [bacterium]|nr:Asp-tRNA(Asn)/Glu-tRNA(Gln) amidotransferase subunit GatB [bacterium]